MWCGATSRTDSHHPGPRSESRIPRSETKAARPKIVRTFCAKFSVFGFTGRSPALLLHAEPVEHSVEPFPPRRRLLERILLEPVGKGHPEGVRQALLVGQVDPLDRRTRLRALPEGDVPPVAGG